MIRYGCSSGKGAFGHIVLDYSQSEFSLIPSAPQASLRYVQIAHPNV
jgi:hypothetical protein